MVKTGKCIFFFLSGEHLWIYLKGNKGQFMFQQRKIMKDEYQLDSACQGFSECIVAVWV
jgi:hypothetical protein